MEHDPPAARADAQPGSARSTTFGNGLLLVIAAAALFWLLREAYAVLMPAVTALLLALGVWPLVAAIRNRVPHTLGWLGPLVGSLVVLGILIAFFTGIGLAARSLYKLASDVRPQLAARLEDLPVALPDFSAFGARGSDPGAISGDLASAALNVLNLTSAALGSIVLILFLMLLMLGEADNWHAKLRAITHGRQGSRRWLEAGQSVGAKFRTYFAARLILGVLTGLLYGVLLFAFGVEYAVLWSLLAVLLGFIPTVGSIISGTLPTIYVFVTRAPADALIVGAGLLVIEQAIGNFLDPKVMGKRLAISPLVVLLALVLWSLLWGLAGALLAVPITVLATVVMAHFDRFKPAALLLTECDNLDELSTYRRPE
jgi:AI-2 transport protein TqsA